MSVIALWIKRMATGAATGGGTTLLTEVVTRSGDYIKTRDGSFVVARQ